MKSITDEQTINLRELNKKEKTDNTEELQPEVKSGEIIEEENKKDNINEDISDNKELFEWEAEEHKYFPKSKTRFFVSAFLFALIEFYLFWTKSFFAFATFLLIFFVVFLYSVRKPRTLKFKIDFQGIWVAAPSAEAGAGKLYKFDNFESFWIFYEPPEVKELFLKKKNRFSQSLSVPIGDEDPAAMRGLLNNYLPEVEEEESLLDVLVRRVGF